jgi:hypothetical protein
MKMCGGVEVFLHHMNQTPPARGVQEDQCKGMSDIDVLRLSVGDLPFLYPPLELNTLPHIST